MRRISWLALVALLALAPGLAKAQFLGPGWWKTASSASYVGPGDLKSGATAWYSCAFAYSAAYAASLGNACGLTRTSDSATCIEKVAANGTGDVTIGTPCNSAASGACSSGSPCTVTTFCTSTTCSVTTMYDQSGNGVTQSCSGGPRLVLTTPFPTVNAAGGSCNGTISITPQPMTFSAVTEQSVGTGDANVVSVYSTTNQDEPAFYSHGANTLRMFTNNGNFTVTAADSALHSEQAVFNGASSSGTVDGVTTSGSVGTPISSSTELHVVGNSVLASGTNEWGEGGMWPVAFSGGDLTAVGHNECVRWGLSC